MKKKVLVINPGLQHSHRLAYALYKNGVLQKLLCGIPLKNNNDRLSFPLMFFNKRIRNTSIDKDKLKHFIIFQLFFKSFQKVGNEAFRNDIKHLMYHVFDYAVSKYVRFYKPDAVVCYENSAYHTFKEAKKIGSICILDAASVHHEFKSNYIKEVSYGYVNKVSKIKDEEIKLADYIVTCSNFAAQSYINSGVNKNKLKVVHLGGVFKPNQSSVLIRECYKRFVFAGSLRELKSIDLLLEAFRQLNDDAIDCELYIYGVSHEKKWLEIISKINNVHYMGVLPHSELIKSFSKYDCMILPSRFDSFGMVVPEAMASGVPAIISTNAGSKEIVESFPNSGWIIKPTADDIYNQVRDLVENYHDYEMEQNSAIEAANHFSWENYTTKINKEFDDIL